MSSTPVADGIAALASGPQLPAEAASTFAAEQARMRAAAAPAGVLPLGSSLPDVELLDAKGVATSVRAVAGGRRAVLVFYRGAWCPYCSVTLRTYQQELVPELDRRDVALVAISPQRPDGSLSAQEAGALTYAVLSDPGNVTASALGVTTEPDEDVRAAQRSLGLELTEVNADGTATLPMPTVAVLDATGRLAWIDVHPDYTTRTEPAQILRALDAG